MDQGGQVRAELDSAVVPSVRGQPGASVCSKSVEGADAFSAFTSVIRTLARNGGDRSVVDRLCRVFSGAPLSFPLNLSTDSPPLINYKVGNGLQGRFATGILCAVTNIDG